MKLTVLVLLLSVLGSWASQGYSQTTRLTVVAKNLKIENFLNSIEDQSEYRFFYSRKIDVERTINGTFENQLINEILDEALKGTDIKYEVKGRQIILSTADALSSGAQQQKSISGKVTDSSGSALPGVTVVVKGTTAGTITDANGNYSISMVPGNSTLLFSFVGMKSQEVTVAGKSSINVKLEEETVGIEEVVAVGYGVQKKTSVTAAISSMEGKEIAATPISNITNSMGGRMSGVIVRQTSGQPGADASSIYIRGIATTGSTSSLIVVDGIPRSFGQIDPNNIASITVLKDAAAVAPYGVAGANGVVLVTTKRGNTGAPTLRYNGYYGFQNATVLPDYVNMEQYASLKNAIARNAGLPIPFPDDILQKHLNGSDPDRYPNWDAMNTMITDNSPITNHNIELSGGTDKIKYFASIGYQYQEGMWKTDYQKKYNLVLNIDAQVTKTTKVSFNVNGIVQDHKEPAAGVMVNQGPEWIFQLFSYATPDKPLFFSNGKYGTYVSPAILASGVKNTDATSIYNQLSIEQELPFIPGLQFKGTFAYDPIFNFVKAWEQTPWKIYTLDITTTPYTFKDGTYGAKAPTLTESYAKICQLTSQASLNYIRSFGKNNITALALFEAKRIDSYSFGASRKNYSLNIDELNMGSSSAADISNSGTSSSARQMGLVYRLTYNYDNKYLFETTGRYDGHYYFAPGKRFGFFPAFSIGWRLSEEKFIKEHYSWIDNLKLRASYGEVGALAGSAFQYLGSYNAYGPAYAFAGSAVMGVSERSEPNPMITWERAKKTDIGLETTLWRGLLKIEADYFYEKRSNMLSTPDVTVPGEYGIGLSQVNSGVMENRGIDFSVGSMYRVSKDLELSISGNLTYAKNKLLKVYETPSTYNNPNRRITGRPLGSKFGYHALGYFQKSDFDANGNLNSGIAKQPWGTVQPGDLRYEDVNKDGKINDDDLVCISDKGVVPGMIYGISPSIRYKGFTLDLMFQGAGGSSFLLYGAGAWPFWGGRNAFKSHLDYWTPENPNAANPRITASPLTNNTQTSNWWLRNTNYLRLKSATLAYNIPSSIAHKIYIQNAQIYLSGQNLFTWTKLLNFDPEVNNGQQWDYPQQQVISIGLNVTF